MNEPGDVRARARVLGLVSDASAPTGQSGLRRGGRLFATLADHADVIGVQAIVPSQPERALAAALHYRRNRDAWRSATLISGVVLQGRARRARAAVRATSPRPDLVLQVHGLIHPGYDVPFLVYTDNTAMISKREWPLWVPDGKRAFARLRAHEQAVFDDAAFVFTCSSSARQSVIDDYGIDPDRVLAIGAGANFLDAGAAPDYTAETALFVGLEFERKGVPELLTAWEQVRQARPSSRLVIGGPNRFDSTPGVEWVQRVPPDEVAGYYDRSSVFVMPSRFEPWGHVFREAMGRGLGCVATDVGGVPELIRPGVTGLVGDIDQLAANLIEALEPSRAAQLGRAALADVLDRGSWDHVARQVANVIDAVVADRA